MNFEKRISVSIGEIRNMLQEGKTKEALEATDRLHKVMCRLGGNKEALTCSYLHTKETLQKAETENRIILGSGQLFHEIELAK